jgi:hypothetical protein
MDRSPVTTVGSLSSTGVKKTSRAGVVFMTLGVLDLIDSDGVDLTQDPVFETPSDNVFDCIEDLLPGSTKRFGSFFPGQAVRQRARNSSNRAER